MKKFFGRFYNKIFEDEIFGRSAEIAFYFFFSLFPLLFFFVSLFGLVLKEASDLESKFFLYLKQIMPIEAYNLVEKTMKEVTEASSGGKITFGLLVAVWSASSGFDSLQSSLNRVYGLQETRSFLKSKLTSIALTIIVGILIFLTVILNLEGLNFLSNVFPAKFFYFLKFFESLIILASLFFAFALVYNLCPNKTREKWRWFSWGTAVSIFLWILVSAGFSLYLRHFNTYAKVYGSLGAVIILMLWFYLTALVILIGAEIDSIFDEMRQGA
ncbi:MAG: YihY/virulence factor BrkB family protein [Acidobacteria bacterium]|jgi:membrane protein|nr:MAG: YihY/virulence factor BrkB family protein [Acidobacteriota bacterium]GIU81748.1 MAG: hypothetical protein KatS3mg006_0812 [Pyrinomonadaceae bacterium]